MGWTNILPGSGLYPDVLLEWAPADSVLANAPFWEDITDLLRGFEWSYGRNDELGTFEAGSGFVALDNQTRLFDPSYSGEDTTNECTNGGFETNVAGWVASAPNTIARSTEQGKFRTASAKCSRDTGTADTNCGGFAMTLTAAQRAVSAWVLVPTAFDGTGVRLTMEGFAGATGTLTANADLVKRDQWQRLTLVFTPVSGDLTGSLVFRLDGATTGAFVYVDGVQVEQKAAATRYVETDGASRSRAKANIKPRRLFRLRARYNGVEYPILLAHARGLPQSYPAAGFDKLVRVDLLDDLALIQRVDLDALGFNRPEERSDQRVAAVLDEASIPASRRDLQEGSATVAPTDDNSGDLGSGLQHTKEVGENSEGWPIYVTRAGKFAFL